MLRAERATAEAEAARADCASAECELDRASRALGGLLRDVEDAATLWESVQPPAEAGDEAGRACAQLATALGNLRGTLRMALGRGGEHH